MTQTCSKIPTGTTVVVTTVHKSSTTVSVLTSTARGSTITTTTRTCTPSGSKKATSCIPTAKTSTITHTGEYILDFLLSSSFLMTTLRMRQSGSQVIISTH